MSGMSSLGRLCSWLNRKSTAAGRAARNAGGNSLLVAGRVLGLPVAALLLLGAFPSDVRATVAVDVVLCLDSTGSMSGSEWTLEKNGTVTGLRNALAGRLDGRTRITVVQFPGSSNATNGAAGIKVAPTVMDSQTVLDAVATTVSGLPQLTGGGTNISSCIDVAKTSLCGAGNCPNDTITRIIDISTDGAATTPTNATTAQAAAVASANAAMSAGVDAVNVIGVGSGFELADSQAIARPTPVQTFYAAQSQFPSPGDRGFVLVVTTFSDYTPAIAAKLTAELAICGNGTIDDQTEQCDQGAANGKAGSCCSGTCTILASGTTCRESAGVCGAAAGCDGSSALCPSSAFLPTTTECRSATQGCDLPENCTGSSAQCPADGYRLSGAVCRAAAGSCDVAETCSGGTPSCPSDTKSISVCRASVGACDVAETCDGVGDDCPADVFLAAATVCHASAGVCDPEETCDGVSATCPADAKSTQVCRASAGGCDPEEACDGSADACPSDTRSSAGTVCRASAGSCDAQETCSGTDPACPADGVSSSSTMCRASAGVCDVAEFCTGTSGPCPADLFVASESVCRSSSGACDAAETCSGSSAACPSDAVANSGTVCRAAAGACDAIEICDGASTVCPADQKSTSVCRSAAGSCDTPETCSGSSDYCPADVLVESGVLCRAAASECDAEERCDGTAASCPFNVTSSLGAPCGSDGNGCTDDVCDGLGGCGVDTTAACDDGTFCNGADTCAAGSCSVHAGYPCGGVDCTTCDETADACTQNGVGTACPDDGNKCSDDECDGAGGCIHPPIVLAPLCEWVVVAGSDTQSTTVRSRYNAAITGSVCADRADVGEGTRLYVLPGTGSSSWALLEDSGTAAKIRADAMIENGSFVTGGGCLTSVQNAAIFGGTPEQICCNNSPVVLPGGNPGNVIDACGFEEPLLDSCAASKAQVPQDIASLDALVATQDLGAVSLNPQETYTITATAGLNVIDVEKLKMNQSSTLILDGQGNQDAVVVLRLARGMSTKVKATVQLVGGLDASKVLFYAATGNCSLGWNNLGAGTLFCPNGKFRMQIDSEWVGAVSGGSGVDIGWSSKLTHMPFMGLALAR